MIHFEWVSQRQRWRGGFCRALDKMNHLAAEGAELKEVGWREWDLSP